MKRLLLLVFSLYTAPLFAQLAKQPPAPLWLRSSTVVEKEFEHHGKLLKAILLGAGRMKVQLNGQDLGGIQASDKAQPLDLTRFIREGNNRLHITPKSERIAVLLELNGDLANTTWLTSDASWQSSSKLATERMDEAANPFDFKKTFDAYNSWQLAKPDAQSEATDASSFTLLPGFKAERIRSAQAGEDSWVSMTFDPKGRVILGREKHGLLRFDPRSNRTQVINDTLLECRGLLFVGDTLFANANNSKGLYRLEDKEGDDTFESVTEILHTEGGVGHGRNHIKLGPDGWIYVAHGNNVLLAKNISEQSPLKHYANDQLLPNPWDDSMFDGNVELPAGHLLRVRPDGSEVQLFAGGLRNPLDIAFHQTGELFTFDADMERDVGTHFYMPTRVLHVVPGADFGWRRGTGRYPAYYTDTLPSVIDIGLSSPTAVFFGYGSQFPAPYQDSLFICDWSYGRIIAVHLKSKGASFSGEQQTFVSGRPLNVTDGCIGPDGALWFITGGRGTQSGLYRISAQQPEATKAVLAAKPMPVRANVASRDPFIRHAGLMDMRANIDQIQSASMTERHQDWETLSYWLVAVTSDRQELRDAAISALPSFDWDSADETQRLALLRALAIGLSRGAYGDSAKYIPWLESKWTGKASPLSWELTKLLIHFQSPNIVSKACELLKVATSSEDLVFYPMHLRYVKQGWMTEQRRIVFDALNRAEKMNGASTYFKVIADTRSELAAALTPDEAQQLAAVITLARPVALSPHALPGHSFKNWQLADLTPLLDQVGKGRSFEQAKRVLISSQCVFCHRVGSDSNLPAGTIGPDLSLVSARFGRRDLLLHIIQPSTVIDDKFKLTLITRTDGSTVAGTLEREDDERVVLKPNALTTEVIEIGKSQVSKRELSLISPMPPGLLNPLKADQILDLLAWFETGGDPRAKQWSK